MAIDCHTWPQSIRRRVPLRDRGDNDRLGAKRDECSPFWGDVDALVEEALLEYEAGKTRSIRALAAEQEIDL